MQMTSTFMRFLWPLCVHISKRNKMKNNNNNNCTHFALSRMLQRRQECCDCNDAVVAAVADCCGLILDFAHLIVQLGRCDGGSLLILFVFSFLLLLLLLPLLMPFLLCNISCAQYYDYPYSCFCYTCCFYSCSVIAIDVK